METKGKMVIIPVSEIPTKEVFSQVEMQLHRLIKIIGKYPQKDDNIEYMKEGLKFIEFLSWKIGK